MSLVSKMLLPDNEKIINKLIHVIKQVLNSGICTASTDLKKNIKIAEDNHRKLLELYFSGEINETEFNKAESEYKCEIEKLRRNCQYFVNNSSEAEKNPVCIEGICKVISEIINGVNYEDDFYRHILNKIVIIDHDNIDIYNGGQTCTIRRKQSLYIRRATYCYWTRFSA